MFPHAHSRCGLAAAQPASALVGCEAHGHTSPETCISLGIHTPLLWPATHLNPEALTCLQDITFYGLPDHAIFYAELVEMAAPAVFVGAAHATVLASFTKFDFLHLGQIMGASRAAKMLKQKPATYILC